MNLIQNLILTNVFVILIYLVYKGAFSQSRFFQANRIFLLIGSVLALILPWISPAMDFLTPANEIQWLPTTASVMDVSSQPAVPAIIEPVSSISPLRIALVTYLVIIAAIAAIYAVIWIKLVVSTRKNPVYHYGPMKVIEMNTEWSAFSYFRTVYYPKPFNPSLHETKLILEHELVHARQLHTLDNLFCGTLRLAFFFNPFIHLLHKELMITHEFLADRLTSGRDRTGYSRILISHQLKIPHFVLIHPFNKQSFLQRRLNMLTKNTQNHLAGWKYLLVLPLLGGMILGSSWTVTAQDQNEKKKKELTSKVEKQLVKLGFVKTGEHSWDKDGITVIAMDTKKMDEMNAQLKKAQEAQIRKEFESSQQTFLIVEEMPTFQGGKIDDFRNWVQNNVKYPEEAKTKKISGTEFVSFVVDTLGKVDNIQIIRSVDPILDAEVIGVIKSSPAWKPGKQRGRLVNVSFAIPVQFKLQ